METQSQLRNIKSQYGSNQADIPLNEVETDDQPNQETTNQVFSAAIIILCTFIGDSARGINTPTLWAFIRTLGGQRTHLGLAVAAFSAGRIVSSPVFGHYSEVFGYRKTLLVCNVIILIGGAMYMSAHSILWIILAQSMMGIGAGR